jgi:hypothetical protein
MYLPCENHSSSSLDIIIETLGLPVSIQVLECLFRLEIFELNEHVGVDLLHSCHEVVHKFQSLLWTDALLAKAKVQGVAKIVLVGSTAIENYGKGLVGVDTCSGSV